jgi:hypothetical protein
MNKILILFAVMTLSIGTTAQVTVTHKLMLNGKNNGWIRESMRFWDKGKGF